MGKDTLKSKLVDNELDLSLSDLKEVPVRELATIPKATSLDLSCNSLLSLPPSFCTLKHLLKLDLSKNQLTELPEDFGNLSNLQRLDLYSNQLKVVPVSFCRLTSLRWLDLKNNPLDANLKNIAGDCLDERQCQTCAKKVTVFMATVNDALEKEKEKKLVQEKKKQAQKKAQKERKEEQLRLKKKAEKERLKEERRNQRLLKFQENNGLAGNEKSDINDNHKREEQVKRKRKERAGSPKKKNANSCFWIFAIVGVLLASTAGIVWHYTGGDLSEKQLNVAFQNLYQDADAVWRKCTTVTSLALLQAEKYFRLGSILVLEKTHTCFTWLQSKIEEFTNVNATG